jgi:regulator of RNase E activity RraA
MIDSSVLDKLRTFDTPTICNVIELFEVRPRSTGYMDARIRACFPEMPPMVGFAGTATFRSAAPPGDSDVYENISQQVKRFKELSGPPIVVFQDLDEPSAGATFGEIMCASYKAFGAVGLITSGAGRDLEQVRELDFPVFTSGATCAHAYCHIPQIHVPVHVGGLTVFPNALLHGDRNGVTTIPGDIAAEVADAAAEFAAAENGFLDALRRVPLSFAEFEQLRREKKAQIDRLRERVSRLGSPTQRGKDR